MFFVYKKLSLGGAETLIFRVARALQKEETCRVLCASITQEAKRMFDKGNIQVSILQKWDPETLAYVINSEKAMFYSPGELILVSDVLQAKKIINNCFLYIVHLSNMGLQSKRFSFLNKRLNKESKYLMNVFETSGRVVFMDEMCANSYKKLYGYANNIPFKILRLPLEEPKILQERTEHGNAINILSIARAEFPFKGYLIGLIKEFQNARFAADIKLTIISHGDGFPELKELSERKTDNNRVQINVLGQIDYEQLNKYYRNSDLYIGMGTTVIEAAANRSVSIPVRPYTYKLVSDKFFFENPQCIALEKDGDIPTTELISRYINSSKEEREEMKRKSYQAFKDNYSMSAFLQQLNHFQFKQKNFKVSKITKAVLKLRMKN